MSERVIGGYSLFPEHRPELCSNDRCHERGRVVKCTGDMDVIECGTCGKQWEAACNFDEDMS